MIYFDNSSTTAPSQAAIDAVNGMLVNFGNPSSLHRLGAAAQTEMDEAREAVAGAVGASPSEIFFTSGGTEANNTAITGGAAARRRRGNKIVITAVEHDSVLMPAKNLESAGFRVETVAPGQDGTIDPSAFERAVDGDTVLVSCMMVNNETGAVFPVEKLRDIVVRAGAPALIHVDAVQALGKLRISVQDIGCDMMTLSAHKIHGIKGCGALYVKKGVTVRPFMLGGGQERGFRAGTEATAAIAAFGAACRELNPAADAAKMLEVKEELLRGLAGIPQVIVNSPGLSAPHIINFSVPGYRSETLLHAFEARDIYVSSGSACKKGALSHVLIAQGLSRERADSAVRVSLCRDNTPDEAARFIAALKEIISTVAHVRARS